MKKYSATLLSAILLTGLAPGLQALRISIRPQVEWNTSHPYYQMLSESEREVALGKFQTYMQAEFDYNLNNSIGMNMSGINGELINTPLLDKTQAADAANLNSQGALGRDYFVYPSAFSAGFDMALGFSSKEDDPGAGLASSVTGSVGFNPTLLGMKKFLGLNASKVHITAGFASMEIPKYWANGVESSSNTVYGRFNYRLRGTSINEMIRLPAWVFAHSGSSFSTGLSYQRVKTRETLGEYAFLQHDNSTLKAAGNMPQSTDPSAIYNYDNSKIALDIGTISDAIVLPLDYSIDMRVLTFLHFFAGAGVDIAVTRSKVFVEMDEKSKFFFNYDNNSNDTIQANDTVIEIDQYDVSVDDANERYHFAHNFRIFSGFGVNVYSVAVYANLQLHYPTVGESYLVGAKMYF